MGETKKYMTRSREMPDYSLSNLKIISNLNPQTSGRLKLTHLDQILCVFSKSSPYPVL